MNKKEIAAVLAVAALLATGACRGSSPPESSASQSTTPADPKAEALLHGFAAAIVARDYASAYAAVATERRASLSLAEFQEAIGSYRGGMPDALKTEVQLEPFDRESASVVPDEFLDRIVSEGVVFFEPEGDDAEGFSVQLWIMNEAGEPRLASFFVGD